MPRQPPAADPNASWETLVIPPSLKETLQAYCKILRNYKDYQAQGVHLPKGLLLHGPAGSKRESRRVVAQGDPLQFNAPRGSPAASARAAAVISESI